MRPKKVNFLVIIANIVVVTILRKVDAFPSDLFDLDQRTDTKNAPSHIVDLLDAENNNDVTRLEENLENLQKIFGIGGHTENRSEVRKKIPPQFMMELYNTIADSSGVAHGKNPYNAKVVRSFIEKETEFSHLYLFNISGMEINESVLEAELHLYRKRASYRVIHPTILTSPYYLIRVYQVLEGKSINEPELHKLLNVHYVGAHASGWQVFNVKQAVLSWFSGVPNLGLLVTASNLFEDEVAIEFSRRRDYHGSKQPILVLFNDDGSLPSKSEKVDSRYYTYEKEEMDETRESENAERFRSRRSVSSASPLPFLQTDFTKEYSPGNQQGDGEPEVFRRVKKIDAEIPSDFVDSSNSEDDRESIDRKRDRQSKKSVKIGTRMENRHDDRGSKKSAKIVTPIRNRQTLSSMDIYERAMWRESMKKKIVKKHPKLIESKDRRREKRSFEITDNDDEEESKSESKPKKNTTECARHELYVNFKEIGLSSWIIAPIGYSAYHCKGTCDFPLSQDQQPTNHATVQGLVHKMGIRDDVRTPCCVPTKLLTTSVLYFDEHDNVVLKVYADMVADRCGCR